MQMDLILYVHSEVIFLIVFFIFLKFFVIVCTNDFGNQFSLLIGFVGLCDICLVAVLRMSFCYGVAVLQYIHDT